MVLGYRPVIVVGERERTVDRSVLPGVYCCVSRKSGLKAVRTSRREWRRAASGKNVIHTDSRDRQHSLGACMLAHISLLIIL
jgi:hypothetical protein